MNIDQIKTALRTWVVDNTALAESNVVFANQNAPRPSRPYITIFVTTTPLSEHANVGAPDDDGDAVIENETAVMASIQCFGDTAYGVLEGLRGSLEKVTVQQALRAAGLPYIRTLSGVADLTETVGTQFEGRAGMDLEFRAVATVTDNVGVIESVEGTGIHETGTNTNYENDYQIGA